MTKPRFPAREVPMGIGFYAPQSYFAEATEAFLRDLFAAEKSAQAHATNHSEVSALLGEPAKDIERYSMAVQIFAVFTLEASLAAYGVMRFGETIFNDKMRRAPLPERIDALFADRVTGDVSQLKDVVRQLTVRRDRIVHPLSGEYEHASDGTPLRRPAIDPPDTSIDAAVAVYRGMRHALELIRRIDTTVAGTMAVPIEAFRRLPQLDERPDAKL